MLVHSENYLTVSQQPFFRKAESAMDLVGEASDSTVNLDAA